MVTESDMQHEAFEPVERLFREQISVQRLHPGASLAVWRAGRLVLDLYAGIKYELVASEGKKITPKGEEVAITKTMVTGEGGVKTASYKIN